MSEQAMGTVEYLCAHVDWQTEQLAAKQARIEALEDAIGGAIVAMEHTTLVPVKDIGRFVRTETASLRALLKDGKQ